MRGSARAERDNQYPAIGGAKPLVRTEDADRARAEAGPAARTASIVTDLLALGVRQVLVLLVVSCAAFARGATSRRWFATARWRGARWITSRRGRQYGSRTSSQRRLQQDAVVVLGLAD